MSSAEAVIVQKTPDICGGQSRIRDTRIPVWLLVRNRKSGQPDADVLRIYPTLTQADLDAARRGHGSRLTVGAGRRGSRSV